MCGRLCAIPHFILHICARVCTRERIIVIEEKTLKFPTNECIFFWNDWQLTQNNARETDVWMPLLHNGHHLYSYSNSNAGSSFLSLCRSRLPLWHILAVGSQCKIINSGLFICIYVHVCTSGPHCAMEVEYRLIHVHWTFYIVCTRCVRSTDTIFKSSSNVGCLLKSVSYANTLNFRFLFGSLLSDLT